jgi:4-amino-4-deoxychorismate lyase
MTLAHASQHWMDGKPLTESWVPISMDSPLLQTGEGWFETIRVESGVPLRLAAHLARLRTALLASGMREKSLRDALAQGLDPALVAAQQCPCARLRLIAVPAPPSSTSSPTASPSTSPAPSPNATPSVLVSLSPYNPPEKAYGEGLAVITSRWPHPRSGHLGKSLSYHWSRVARREAELQGAEEALLTAHGIGVDTAASAAEHAKSGWLEASTASLLWPGASGWCSTSGLAGTLASVTVEGLRQLGVAVSSRSVAPRHEIFERGLLLVSALRLVVAVRSIDGQPLPDLTAAAAQLRARLLAREGAA